MSRKVRGHTAGLARRRLTIARGAREPEPERLTDAEAEAVIRNAKAWLDGLRAKGYDVEGDEANVIDEAAKSIA